MSDDLTTRLAEDAFSACRADFAREQGRPLSDDEEGVARRTSELCVQWFQTQPPSRFALDRTLYGKVLGVDRARRREERRSVRECKRYVKEHWSDGDGFGFILALISAVLWHLMVVLIVRWLIKKFIENQVLAAQVCKG